MASKQELVAELNAASATLKDLKLNKTSDDDSAAILLQEQLVDSIKAKLKNDKESKSGGSSKVALKTPKGMRDRDPRLMALQQELFDVIVSTFEAHGAEALDTPTPELKEILTGKYGEESKLIYDLADQGGEKAALRYDFTVPFARYIAQNKVSSMRRYQLGKVYRRDQPSLARGRYREFYQCDFDIAGELDRMTADAECVVIVNEILRRLPALGPYLVRVNHRGLLDGLLSACGVPPALHKPTLSAVDKLDKCSWTEVRRELVSDKGVSEAAADLLHRYVSRAPGAGPALIAELLTDELLCAQPVAVAALEELQTLFRYLTAYGLDEGQVRLDLGLARGLDYYTGLIYEAVLADAPDVGSVAGGGRYDELVGKFCGVSVPCVGVSLGVERLLSVLKARRVADGAHVRTSQLQVFVCNAHKGLLEERMRLCAELWRAGLRAGHSHKRGWKLLSQLQRCEEQGVPLAIILGEDEVAGGVARLRVVGQRGAENDRVVARCDLVPEIRAWLAELGLGSGA